MSSMGHRTPDLLFLMISSNLIFSKDALFNSNVVVDS